MHNIILPLFHHGCVTCLLKLREKRRLRVRENGVLRRIFGPERGDVTQEWRKLNKEELSDMYSATILLG